MYSSDMNNVTEMLSVLTDKEKLGKPGKPGEAGKIKAGKINIKYQDMGKGD